MNGIDIDVIILQILFYTSDLVFTRYVFLNTKKFQNLMQQGYVLQKQNNLPSALRCFEKAKKIGPRIFDVWFALGNLHVQSNNLDQAVIAFEKAIKISPDNFMAHGQLGVTLYKLQRLDEAITCYKKVIDLQPGNISGYANLAIAYIDVGNREEAVACCLHAIKLNPEFIGGHLLLASAYSSLGRYEEALESYNKVLVIEKENSTAIAGKSDSLIKLGRKSEAYTLLRSRVDQSSVDPSIVIAYASACPDMACKKQASAYLEEALISPRLLHKQRLQLHFSAGRLYDQMERYADAFQHYEKGNNLAQRKYDALEDSKLFDDMIRVYAEPFAHPDEGVSCMNITPVFIIGMPRSGTSLVERILGSHTNIYPAGELGEIPKIAERLSHCSGKDSKFPECMDDVDINNLNKLSDEHIQFLTKISNNSKLVTDKLPHNFLFLGLIQGLFPNAKIIHCKRDPLDTCISNYFQYFSSPLSYPYNLKNLAEHYNNYQRLMKHWKEVIQLPMLELNYEDLVMNQKVTTTELLSFLGLSLEESCLDFNKSKHVTRTASYEQVTEPIYTRSIGRWRHYEKFIGDLISNLIIK